MKNKFKSFLYCALTCALLSSGGIKGIAQEIVKKSETPFSFNMLEVKGNVRLYLRQGNIESMRIETTNDSEKVSINRVGYKLFVSSNEFNPIDVYITVIDLRRIQVSEQAIVATIGELKFRNFQIFLEDNALARLKVNTSSLYTIVKGNSYLKLNGASVHYTSVTEKSAKLDTNKFVALKTEVSELLVLSDLSLNRLGYNKN